MQLPGELPEGCNFYGLLQTALDAAAIAARFGAAGWEVTPADGQQCLQIAWGQLTLRGGNPMVLQGWIDKQEGIAEVLALLGGPGLTSVSQWINAVGRLWREMPFDDSMLDPEDPRLPADIKESIRDNSAGTAPPKPQHPWWRSW